MRSRVTISMYKFYFKCLTCRLSMWETSFSTSLRSDWQMNQEKRITWHASKWSCYVSENDSTDNRRIQYEFLEIAPRIGVVDIYVRPSYFRNRFQRMETKLFCEWFPLEPASKNVAPVRFIVFQFKDEFWPLELILDKSRREWSHFDRILCNASTFKSIKCNAQSISRHAHETMTSRWKQRTLKWRKVQIESHSMSPSSSSLSRSQEWNSVTLVSLCITIRNDGWYWSGAYGCWSRMCWITEKGGRSVCVGHLAENVSSWSLILLTVSRLISWNLLCDFNFENLWKIRSPIY